MSANDTSPLASPWRAVTTVAGGTFLLVTTEILPVGLLNPIALALETSPGVAGLSVTASSLVAAIAAFAVILGAGRLDRKKLLLMLTLLLGAGNAVCAAAQSMEMFLAARLLVGVSIGGFWAVAAGLGPRLVPDGDAARATTRIFGGIAVASVLGVPCATLLGDALGWRYAFGLVSLACMVLAGGLLIWLPRLPSDERVSLAGFGNALANKGIRMGLVVTVLAVTGHFAAFTFVRPLLQQTSGLPDAAIGFVLLAYGLFGVLGNFRAGHMAGTSPGRALLAVLTGKFAGMLCAAVLAGWPPAAILAVIVWGMANGGLGVALQTWMLRHAGPEREAATTVFVSLFNLAIAAGAFGGGRLVDTFTPPAAVFVGAMTLAATVLVVMRHTVPRNITCTSS